jgi:hypothetical protein
MSVPIILTLNYIIRASYFVLILMVSHIWHHYSLHVWYIV